MSSVDTQIILSSPDKWTDWIGAIQLTAETKEIWDMVNPDLTLDDSAQRAHKPDLPAGHLDKDGPTRWAIILYQERRKQYDDQKEALYKLNLRIMETVCEAYRGYARKDTPYLSLVSLKKHVPLNAAAQVQSLRARYHKILWGPKGTKTAEWLQQYKRLVIDMTKAKLTEMESVNPL